MNKDRIDSERLLEVIRACLLHEGEQIKQAATRINEAWVRATDAISHCGGRVITAGVGKSGLVARRFAAMLTSIGISAQFLHPVEAVHGDLGGVDQRDLAICFSQNGETDELLALLPYLKERRVTLVAVTGKLTSRLANECDVVLDSIVDHETDEHGMLPTASATLMTSMGNALVCAVMTRLERTPDDFAQGHPGGALGRRLRLRVADLMHTDLPAVDQNATIRQSIAESTRIGLGVVLVMNGQRQLLGIFTDGDMRRLLGRHQNPLDLVTVDQMNAHPKIVKSDQLASETLEFLSQNAITVAPVLGEHDDVLGVIHLHDLLRARVN